MANYCNSDCFPYKQRLIKAWAVTLFKKIAVSFCYWLKYCDEKLMYSPRSCFQIQLNWTNSKEASLHHYSFEQLNPIMLFLVSGSLKKWFKIAIKLHIKCTSLKPLQKTYTNTLSSKTCMVHPHIHMLFFLLFLSHFFSFGAAYNVVKDHSGNASSAVTKYPYSKHISRACNLLPPNPRVTFNNSLATCRKKKEKKNFHHSQLGQNNHNYHWRTFNTGLFIEGPAIALLCFFTF